MSSLKFLAIVKITNKDEYTLVTQKLVNSDDILSINYTMNIFRTIQHISTSGQYINSSGLQPTITNSEYTLHIFLNSNTNHAYFAATTKGIQLDPELLSNYQLCHLIGISFDDMHDSLIKKYNQNNSRVLIDNLDQLEGKLENLNNQLFQLENRTHNLDGYLDRQQFQILERRKCRRLTIGIVSLFILAILSCGIAFLVTL
jgi:hypothetical protein